MDTYKATCNCGQCNKVVPAVHKAGFLNIFSAVLYIIFPKCALCWAAYASFFSFLGFDQLKYNAQYQKWILLILGIGSAIVIYRHIIKKAWLNLSLFSSALLIMFLARISNIESWLVIVLIAGLMLVSHYNFSRKVKYQISISE